MSVVPKISLPADFDKMLPYLRVLDDPQERREKELGLARGIADRYGFKLVEADRCVALTAFTRTSKYILYKMDDKERKHYEQYRDRQIVRHLAEDAYQRGLVSFETRRIEDKSFTHDGDEQTSGKLLVVKPRITHDETNATD